MSGGPVDHIERAGVLWRPVEKTECGRPLGDVKQIITREELAKRVKREGVRRACYSACQTCLTSMERNPTWAEDPLAAMLRDFSRWGGDPERDRREVVAIAALIAAHRDEFDGHLLDMEMADAVKAEERRQRWLVTPRMIRDERSVQHVFIGETPGTAECGKLIEAEGKNWAVGWCSACHAIADAMRSAS